MAGSGFFGDAAAQCFGGQDFDKAGLVVVSFIAVDIDERTVFFREVKDKLDICLLYTSPSPRDCS